MSTTVDETAADEISPILLVEAMFAVRRTGAIKAAIELDLFTTLGPEGGSAQSVATALGAAERGIRILCDCLVVNGFLTKAVDRYTPTLSTIAFLDRRSPSYLGDAIEFIAAPEMVRLFLDDPAAIVRNGGSVGLANISADNPVWVKFARAMGPFTRGAAAGLAAEVAVMGEAPRKILDIAAGPGFFGIEMGKVFPAAEIVAVDWASVLSLSQEHAEEAGIADRYRPLPGSAFDVDWGGDYDLVLLPNFLHHFDIDTCVNLLTKVRASLSAKGRVAGVEFVPNDDRISPPFPAAFSWEMLVTTPKGDAYTEKELAEMGRLAGFRSATVRPLPRTPASMFLLEP
ncbi:class I SAM-dependent methyltransferase [Sinorhizobium sp. BG8]|uniref:methyltransferase n=1 Tax=Sinorhizobium sp. BG8 TaxID=2613773 RepID=UPI00193E7E04|nr:class I SAM-dependent methyltransferase [Sinorhizobium sp. BG8]QRM56431.1 SAM-dependent methyltransferase [Sinorhizobium sp. BG8]